MLLINAGMGAFSPLPARADEGNSIIPFLLPNRPRFVIPESKPSVIPETNPEGKPETNPPAGSEVTPDAAPRRSSSKANRRRSSKLPESSPSVANSAPASAESAPQEPAPTTPAPTATTSATSTSAAPPSDTFTSAAPISTSSGKRYVLQGKTEVIDFKLSEFDAYKQGMAALDRRNYADAQIQFRAGAAKLGDGYEKYRAECNFFEAKCLMMTGKIDQAVSLLKAAIALFGQHDPLNPYKLAAEKQVGDLISGRARMDNSMLQGRTNMQRARVSVDQNITLYSRLAVDDSDPVLLRADREATKTTIHDCFAEMTCLETAEIGSNVYSAMGKWQPLLVKGEPAAIEFGAKPPVINVKVNGQLKEVTVNLPMVNGLRRILLATDNEKVAAIDVDNNDTWLLLMDTAPDGTVGRFRWALLRHQKQKSATWGVSRNKGLLQRPTGDAWGARPPGNIGNAVRGQGNNINLYSPFKNSRNKF
ncbi:MAG: hypothetical protein IT342_23550 [Candidatus Melainabacteria bacterium]|nr:hypothetical protein [Candidatus Melainabacteria bacterium]